MASGPEPTTAVAGVGADRRGELARAVELISQAGSLGLVCHVGPDGDALGSMLALHHLALAQGRDSWASWPEPFLLAPHYHFLPGADLATKSADFPRHPDVVVSFDCGSLDRLAELGPVALDARDRGRLVVVDHHVTNDRFGSVNLIDPSAAATAVLVRRLAEELGWPLTREAAICLFTGLVTDTGRFQYDNTTPSVFALAEELAGFDLPIAQITRELFEKHRFAYLQLVAACLGRAELDADLGLVSTCVTLGDFERFDVSLDEVEGLIDLLRRAAEADVACVLKETPSGVRVSLRSLGTTDVSTVAVAFGGGGHRFAAGFSHPGPLPATLAALRVAVAGAVG